MKFEEIVQRFEGQKRQPNGSYMVRCKAHKDGRPSLHLTRGNTGTLCRCFAGCDTESIVKAAGLNLADLFDEPLKAEVASVAASYDYPDERGRVVLRVHRKAPKGFWQEFLTEPKRWPLYNLPNVIEAVSDERDVWVVEGEKDASNLIAMGLVATTNPMGAGKWRPEHTDSLMGARRVIIVSDLDEPGQKHAEQVRDALLESGGVDEVLMRYPAQGKDVSDHIEAGLELSALMEQVGTALANVVTLRDIETAPEELEIIVPRLAWRGRLSMLSARTKRGKSTLVAQAVALASKGEEFLGESGEPITALYFSPDESPIDTVSKLREYKADPDRVWLQRPRSMASLYDLIDEMPQLDLVVVDSFIELVRLETGEVDENSSEVSNHLRKLASLAHNGDYAIMVIAHGGHNHDRPRGSSAIMGAVDQIIVMESPDEDYQNNNIRTLKYTGRKMLPDLEIVFGFMSGYVTTENITLADRIIVAVAANPGISRSALRKDHVKVRKADISATVQDMLYSGTLTDDGGLYIKE